MEIAEAPCCEWMPALMTGVSGIYNFLAAQKALMHERSKAR
jgi:hypothetical protein